MFGPHWEYIKTCTFKGRVSWVSTISQQTSNKKLKVHREVLPILYPVFSDFTNHSNILVQEADIITACKS